MKGDHFFPTTTGRYINREELASGLWAMNYQEGKYEPTMWCVCNNKNCLYRHTLPVSWKHKIDDKQIRCFECQRSFFNVAPQELSDRLQAYYAEAERQRLLRGD